MKSGFDNGENVPSKTSGFFQDRGCVGVFEFILLSVLSVFALYQLYFLMAPWVWSQNKVYPVEKLTPWIIGFTKDHDGAEVYVLYLLMLAQIALTFLLAQAWRLLPNFGVRRGAMWMLVLVAAVYCFVIKFIPPMSSVSMSLFRFLGAGAAALFLGLLCIRKKSTASWEILGAIILLIPVCFIATEPIHEQDYAFLFLPAQKLMTGFMPGDIYFQYDIFLSFLSMVWMKLGFSLWQFQFLGQFAYFAAILGVYLISRQLFQKKQLCLLLFCALVLIRIYASPWDVSSLFQITPWRLDLWLILFVMIFYLGAFHWTLGLVCGLLILFHRNFGIIYSVAYIQLIFTLGLINIVDSHEAGKKVSAGRIAGVFKKAAIPLILIGLAYGVSQILFGKNIQATAYYQKIGIGFLPVSRVSFFWYCPVIMSTVFMLLVALRKHANRKPIVLGFFLLYCTIGNTIYFFGRSHENNLLNISISWVFLFFYGLDLLDLQLNGDSVPSSAGFFRKKHAALCLGIFFIASSVFWYAGNIIPKLEVQFGKMRSFSFQKRDVSHTVRDNDVLSLLKDVKLATNNSKDVQFFGFDPYAEFLFYRYGKYQNEAFFSPFPAWIFTDDLVRHAQGLIDRGYYLLLSSELYRMVFRTRLESVDKFYQTKNKNYILVTASPQALELRRRSALSGGALSAR